MSGSDRDPAPAPPAAPPTGSSDLEGTTIARRAGVVALFTLVSRILGYGRDAVLANLFGASAAQDAFIVAQTIPNLLRRLVAEGALMIAFVPLLSAEKTQGGIPAMRRFTGALLGVLVPVLLFFVGAGVLFPGAAVKAFAAGFDPERAELAARLTQVMMGYLFFISLTAVAGGALNTQGVFGPTAASPVLLNIVLIAAPLYFRDHFEQPIESAAWGFLIGGALQLLLQLPFLAKEKLLVPPARDLAHPSLRLLGRRLVPSVFGLAVYQFNVILIRQIASVLPEGQLACYYFATRLEEFALGVFAVSISIAALPTLSEHAARGDVRALFATFRRALRATNFITVPAMVGLFVLAGPIVGVLFRHGRITAEDAALTADLVAIMALAIAVIGGVRVIVPTYYAVGDTRTPVYAGIASLAATALLGWSLKARYEIYGLTVATIAGALAQLAVLALLLRARVRAALAASRASGERPPAGDREPSVAGHALRCLLAVAPGGALAWLAARGRNWYGGENLMGAVVLAGIMAAVMASYLAMARLLRVPEVSLLAGAIRRRLHR